MGLDSQGISRGVCNHPNCTCKEFTKRKSSAKCNCGHAPTAHVSVFATGAASGYPAYHGKDTVGLCPSVNIRPQGYFRQPSDPNQSSCHTCYSAYPANIGACPLCFKRDNCPCGNMKFYDPMYGAFEYCSPSCRDKFLLPSYNIKLQEDLKKNPRPNDGGSTAGGDFSTTVLYSPPVSAGTRTANTEAALQSKQCTYAVKFPASDSCIHFYKNVWSEANKYGLYITGLTLGEDAGDLRLGDIIYGVGGEIFKSNTKYKDMILKYNIGTNGRVHREDDYEQICKKANKEALAIKCDSGNEKIAFFLRKTEVSGMGLKPQDHQVVIMKVDEESIAGRSGIQTGDIIRSIGNVNRYPKNDIEFTKVTKKEHVASPLTRQSLNVIGCVLIIERVKVSYV